MRVKVCTKCGCEKPVAAFYKRGDGGCRDPYRSTCKDCYPRTAEQRERRRDLHAKQPERHVLEGMIQRCHNPNNPAYKNYGGRGITVCDRWRESFDAFLEDVGPRPSPEHTIERKKNAIGYEPGNCVWATRAVQARNTRQNVLLTVDDVTLCREDWAKRIGARSGALIRDRMQRLGWDARRAVTTPVQSQGRKAS